MTQTIDAAAQLAALISTDTAILVPTNEVADTPAAGDNSNVMLKQKALAHAQVYGSQHARGEASLTNLAFYFSAGCRAGFLSEGDAEALYKAFIAGHNHYLANVKVMNATGHEAMPDDEKSIKVPVSIFRTFGKPAAVAMGDTFYERVVRVRHTVGAADRAGSAYNAFVKCNREVVKLAEKSVKVEVSDDEIRAWISKAPTASKDDIAKLAELVAKLAKMANAQTFIGLSEPVAELERFVAKVKLGVNRPNLTIVPQTPGEVAIGEREDAQAEAEEKAA